MNDHDASPPKVWPIALLCVVFAACALPDEAASDAARAVDGAPVAGEFDDFRRVHAELTASQRRARYVQIRDAAATRGITSTGYLLAGIAHAETGLAHCWSEATWACRGPNSSDCGGGPVIAGSADGPCGIQQGGLGMFQFDAGTYSQTLAAYGSHILTVAGNTSQALDFVVNMVRRSTYTSGASTDALALRWIIDFDISNATLRDQWIRTVTRYYNGCRPTSSCWSSRIASYNASLQTVLDETGLDFWEVRTCQCDAGETRSRGCGRCGTQTRSCGSDCQWRSWSGCTGQGPCEPGASQAEACCDCGERSRSCNDSCRWRPWSACAGADPNPAVACDTGAAGACAVGSQRCVEGCLTCADTVTPSDEVCDGIDNDCDATADEGRPAIMGDSAPEWGARVVAYSLPQSVREGEAASAWVQIRNEGSAVWNPGEVGVRLAVSDPEGAEPDLDMGVLDPDGSWPGPDTPVVVQNTVLPDEEVLLEFRIGAPVRAGALEFVVTSMLSEQPMLCPEPAVGVELAGLPAGAAPGSDAPRVEWDDGRVDEPGETPDSGADAGQGGADGASDGGAGLYDDAAVGWSTDSGVSVRGCRAANSSSRRGPWAAALLVCGLVLVRRGDLRA